MIDIPLVRLDPEMVIPTQARSGDAGFDLAAREDATVPAGGGRYLMPTGLAMALPAGFAALVLPRSGLALKQGLSVVNAPGLIDSGYRGEIQVLLLNTDPQVDISIRRGERIAQLMIQEVVVSRFVEAESLPDSDRSTQGWGCLLYTSPSPRDQRGSRMPSSA